jgi:MoxR-like ATPase
MVKKATVKPESEMKRPFMLGMKIGDTRYKVFHVIDWRVKSEFELTLDHTEEDEEASCDCTMYRFKGDCQHAKIISETVEQITSGRDKYTGIVPDLDWKEVAPFDEVVVWTEENGLALISREIGNLSLNEVAKVLSEGMEVVTSLFSLNPKRLYVECMASLTSKKHIGSTDVAEAGETVEVVHNFGDEIEAEAAAEAPPVEIGLTEDDFEALPIWSALKTPKPDSEQFYVDTEVWEQILYALSNGKNVMLTGPSGSGKSELAYIAAKALDMPLEAFNMGAMSEPRTSLIGNTHFNKEKGTWFDESRFAKAIQNEVGVILLDEITRSEPSAFNILMPLMDRQGYLPLDESEDGHVIRRGERVAMISTANVGMEYTGTMALDKALKDRHAVTVDMDFPPEANEVQVLLGRCKGLSKKDAKQLVKVAVRQRELCRIDGEFVEMISTRMLLEAAEQVASGVPFRTACKFCIENQFSSDGGDASDRTKIQQIIQKDLA